MHTQITEFIDCLRARQLAPGTIRPYQTELVRLADYLEARDVHLGDVTQHHLQSYIAGDGLSTSSVNRRLVVLRQFFAYIEHAVTADLAKMKAPKVHRSLPGYLDHEEELQLRKT
ncbi:MAG: site-specific integrase, partial [Lentisphaerota bacterium]